MCGLPFSGNKLDGIFFTQTLWSASEKALPTHRHLKSPRTWAFSCPESATVILFWNIAIVTNCWSHGLKRPFIAFCTSKLTLGARIAFQHGHERLSVSLCIAASHLKACAKFRPCKQVQPPDLEVLANSVALCLCLRNCSTFTVLFVDRKSDYSCSTRRVLCVFLLGACSAKTWIFAQVSETGRFPSSTSRHRTPLSLCYKDVFWCIVRICANLY